MEIWRDVLGYEELYQVSSKGRVRSKDREIIETNRRYLKKGRLLKHSHCGSGYPIFHAYKNGCKRKTLSIHREIAKTFLEYNPYKYVNHKDLNKTNNNLSNLEMVTPSENCKHAVAAGATKVPTTRKLDDIQVLTIKTFMRPELDKVFSNIWGVDKSTICNIRNGKHYKHI